MSELKPIEQAINGAHDSVESAERAFESGQIDEAEYFRRLSAVTTSAYLASDNPRGQSGYSGDDTRWTHARELVAEAINRDGSFLDIGCASGYLMESVQRWCAAKNLSIEPYGLDIAPELAELARSRLAQWKDRIFAGNALYWQPPTRFDFVRTGMYVPQRRRQDFVRHLLDYVVAPGGRLIVGVYNEAIEGPTLVETVRSSGFTIAGRAERPHRDSRIAYRMFWIDV